MLMFSNIYPKLFVCIFVALILTVPSIADEPSKQLSLQESIENVEIKVLHQTYPDDPLILRIERLEKLIWKQEQPGALVSRVNKISVYSNKIKPIESLPENNQTENTTETYTPGLIQENEDELSKDINVSDQSSIAPKENGIEENIQDNKSKKKQKKQKKGKQTEKEPEFDPTSASYYDVLMYVNQNRVIRWSKMPVKVYIPEGNNITYFPEYKQCLLNALDDWKTKSAGKIDYVIVDNPKKSNIKVIWQENFPETGTEAGATSYKPGYNMNQNVAGNLISTASMFIPGAFGMGASLLGSVVGGMNNTIPRIRDVYLRIGTLPAMKLPKNQALAYIQTVASHEFGHAIGINCHSNNINDIMYPEVPLFIDVAKSPSTRDINTVIELYNHDAYITE